APPRSRPRAFLLGDVLAQGRDLRAELHVFAFLAGEESLRHAQPFADAARRQHIEVAELAVAALEVLRLDPAFDEQRLEKVVRLAKADAELSGELALRILRVLLEQAQQRHGG